MENHKIEEPKFENNGGEEREYLSSARLKVSFFEKISFWFLTGLVFLLPVVIYTPFAGFAIDFSKKAVVFGFAFLSLIFWLISRFEEGKLSFPGGMVFKSWIFLFAAYSFSSLALINTEKSVNQSIFGSGYDTDTLIMTFALFVLMFLSSIFYQSIKRLSYFYVALLASLIVVLVVEILQLYTGGGIIIGSGAVSNLVGKWNDLGIFFGLGAILSLSAIELLEMGLYPKVLLWSTLLLSLGMVGVVNYSPIFLSVGFISLLVFIYSLFFFNGNTLIGGYSRAKLVKPSLLVIVVCAILFFSQVKIGEFLSKKNIINMDVRPSLSATIDIAQKTMREGTKNFIFGAGPNNFSSQWVKFKPEAVNNTIFWNIDFNAGIGRIPSSSVTMGLFGLLAWFVFVGLVLYYGFKTVLYSTAPKALKFITFVSFVGTIYLWLFSIIYVTETVLYGMTFMVTGVFVASLARAGTVKNFEFSFLNDPRLGFASVLVLVLLVISTISGGYHIGKKFMANYLYQKSTYVLGSLGDIETAESLIKSSIDYDEQDIYQRTLSEINIVKLSNFISAGKIEDKEAVAKLQDIIVTASASARKSIELDRTNYLNWMSLGRVGEAVVPLKVVDGSYELAVDSYKKAIELNPSNPMILLNMARLEIANNNVARAKEYLTNSLEKNRNFTAALYLLSQIEASQGNLKEAINRSEQAYLLAPDDLGVLFQLGFLKFTNKDYEGSLSPLERAIVVNPQYSNARYFLGLSYAKLKRNSDALNQFKEIEKYNPDNSEVKGIIKNLNQGRDPFDDNSAEPDKRNDLPLSE